MASEKHITEIVHEAMQIEDRAAREAFVQSACGADEALRGRVEALLANATPARGFLDLSAGDSTIDVGSSSRASRGLTEQPGAIIDRYELIERLGEGGFGVVFRAQQLEPVRREVALKIIKLGMDTEQVIARFEAERQALAMMDHPGIATVLDAGTTETGRPYFVMEYVAGEALTNFCDKRGLSVGERLDLFRSVCDAVQHAHQKGIIHRDIKPSNILASERDGQVSIKVIDFGIAKATGETLTDRTLVTTEGQFIGTPAYMSPEQCGAGGADLDTRSDVYSLGVLLYELLTGTTPFDTDTLRGAAIEELRRIVRDVDPPKPSERVSALGKRTTEIAQKRATQASKLTSLVRGDLDWIIMRALEKDRERRYASASELAADVQRFLSHEPVLAGPPTARYRLRKLVRRHRVACAAALVVLVGAAAGVGGVVYGLVRALEAERVADRQRAVAQSINDFLVEDLLAAVAPSAEEGKGRDVRMIEVLDAAAKRIDAAAGSEDRFASEPVVEASIRGVIGRTYQALSAHELAAPQHERELELYRTALGEDDPGALRARVQLASARLQTVGPVQAEAELRAAAERAETVLGETHSTTLLALSNLAEGMMRFERFDEAVAISKRVVELRGKATGAERIARLASEANRAESLAAQGKHAEAVGIFERILPEQSALLGDEHPETLSSLHGLASVYGRQGRYPEAIRMKERVIEAKTRVLGPDHTDTLGAMFNLGVFLTQTGYQERANEVMSHVDARARETLPEGNILRFSAPSILATIDKSRGCHEVAVDRLRHLLDTSSSRFGTRHPQIGVDLVNLAMALRNQGRFEESEARSKEAMAFFRDASGDTSLQRLAVLCNLGEMYVAAGRYEDARRTTNEALELAERTVGLEHPYAEVTMRNLAKLWTKTTASCEDADVCDAIRDAAIRQAQPASATPDDLENAARVVLEELPPDYRDVDRALTYAERACELTERSEPRLLALLAEASFQTGNVERAIRLQREAIEKLPACFWDPEREHDRLRRFEQAMIDQQSSQP